MNEEAKNKLDWIEGRANRFMNGSPSISQKAGLVGSSSKPGQAVQAIASTAIPGDMSDLRSPVRSTIWETLTPGGGRRGLRRPGGRERTYRCPEGYQFGGRFTDSKWSTCGRQLFDIPGLAATLRQIAESLMGGGGGIGDQTPNVRLLAGADAGGDVLKSRAAQIPRVGAFNAAASRKGIDAAVLELTGSPNIPTMMIRRDGFPMQPVVTVGELRKVPDNRNMEGATFLMRAANIDMLGKEELGLLSNTGVTSLMYVLPNGSTIRMDKKRALTVGERRKLGKTVSAAAEIDNSDDPLRRLRTVLEDSGGGIGLTTDFKKISSADEVITSGKNKGKKKWVVEAFKGEAGKRRVSASAVADAAKPESESPVEKGKMISSLDGAVRHIRDGGNLSDIDPSILSAAIRKSGIYKTRKLGAGRTLFQRNDDGVSFTEVRSGRRFEHLGAHVAGSVQEQLGLLAPKVRFTDEGIERPYLVQTADSLAPGGRLASGRLRDSNADDLASLAVADYLTDTRGRSPSNVSRFTTDGDDRVISTFNAPSALAGLSAQELKKRRTLDLPDYLTNDGKALLAEMRASKLEFRKQILEIYETLLDRAKGFNWDRYISALRNDGKLSLAEQKHLDIVQGIYKLRLERLTASRDAFARLLEVDDE